LTSLLVGIATIESFPIMALQRGQHWFFQMIKYKKLHDENKDLKRICNFLFHEV